MLRLPELLTVNTVSDYNLNYFEMPIIVKYRFVNIKSFGIYGSTGIALSLLLNGDYDITSTIEAGGPPIIVKNQVIWKDLISSIILSYTELVRISSFSGRIFSLNGG